jgi:transmembrane sensor
MTQSNQGTDLKAAEWAVRLNARALSAEEQRELDQWLATDSHHRGALLRARAMWADLDRLAAMRGNGEALGARSEKHIDGPDTTATSQVPQASKSRRHFLVAAGLASVCLGGAGLWWIERGEHTYVSKLGEVRRVSLSDGSHMVLNTASEATVRFDKTRREIELASGEGLFQVAKDPTRPFIVHAGPVSVRAVGTIFSVRSANERVDVTVTEGVVELADNSASGGGLIRRVAVNETATVMDTRQVQVQYLRHEEAERRLAWRDGMVDFAGEPLSSAVSEINRHNNRRIVVDDPALASRPVVGLFKANDPDGFATTVATALGARSVEQDDAIHLRLAAAP